MTPRNDKCLQTRLDTIQRGMSHLPFRSRSTMIALAKANTGKANDFVGEKIGTSAATNNTTSKRIREKKLAQPFRKQSAAYAPSDQLNQNAKGDHKTNVGIATSNPNSAISGSSRIENSPAPRIPSVVGQSKRRRSQTRTGYRA